MESQGFVERRRHRRSQVQEEMFVLLRAQKSKLGRVIDMSKGGLAFRYVSIGEPIKGPLEFDLLSHQSDFGLNKLSGKIIFNLELASETPFRAAGLRRVGVQFRRLTEKQESRLEYFLTL